MLDLKSVDRARAEFHAAFPDIDLAELDDLRATEYARLDDQSHVYLDYTGAGLYATSQLREHSALLEQALLGNPHSTNPTSNAAAAFAERARASVLEFFNASADEYTVALTPNATGALKLVGEAYPFEPDSRLVLTADNHNSVNGIREFARAAGTPVTYVPLEQADLRVDPAAVDAALQPVAPGKHALFAYPAQSNLSGVQHPLEWIPLARRRGWDVLLDAAASVPTNRLDVDRWQPDFVAVSFYKIFGYPTGIGCLIARRSALARLRRPWFSGGTIDIVSVSLDAHAMRPDEAGFEDGTINFLGLPAVEIGLRYIQAADIDAVHARVQALTEWLLERMAALRHPNGAPVVQLYGPTNMRQRGGTVAFNVLTPDGEVVDYHRVEQAAGEWNISLRGGCFCNPGAAEAALELTPALLRTAFSGSGEQSRHAWGMVRVSLGIATTPADICRLIEFLTAWPGGGGRNRSDG